MCSAPTHGIKRAITRQNIRDAQDKFDYSKKDESIYFNALDHGELVAYIEQDLAEQKDDGGDLKTKIINSINNFFIKPSEKIKNELINEELKGKEKKFSFHTSVPTDNKSRSIYFRTLTKESLSINEFNLHSETTSKKNTIGTGEEKYSSTTPHFPRNSQLTFPKKDNYARSIDSPLKGQANPRMMREHLERLKVELTEAKIPEKIESLISIKTNANIIESFIKIAEKYASTLKDKELIEIKEMFERLLFQLYQQISSPFAKTEFNFSVNEIEFLKTHIDKLIEFSQTYT